MDTSRLDLSKPLFILEMANNHNGSLDHGYSIIKAMKDAVQGFPFQFAIKFQYRDLPTFIHPHAPPDHKHVKRFRSTALTESQRIELNEFAKSQGFLTICTPFDEPSVAQIALQGYSAIKIGSPSFTDWPLWEAAARVDIPVIASCGGATLQDIDRIVLFLQHRRKQFALMHCIGEYPVEPDHLNLGQIGLLAKRYPGIPIGFSSHEDPENVHSVSLAIASGATLFERHVGIGTDAIPRNSYSMGTLDVALWLETAQRAYQYMGDTDHRYTPSPKESSDLQSLARGIYASTDLAPGNTLSSNFYPAFPSIPGQLTAQNISKYSVHTVIVPIPKDSPILSTQVSRVDTRKDILVIISSVASLLRNSRIALPNQLTMEISHHYGVENFSKHGATIINCINREYCKKLIVMLPGQSHPVHKHIQKEETFHVLYGEINLSMGNAIRKYTVGDMVTVSRSTRHGFSTSTGAIIEEISTTHYANDSFYDDHKISGSCNRKTCMTFWSDWLAKEEIR